MNYFEQRSEIFIFLQLFFQCCIDLKNNVLRIGTTGTETPFLPESEIPESVHGSDSLSTLSEEERRQIQLAKESE